MTSPSSPRDFAESDTLPEHATLCAILLSVDAVPRAIPFPTREQLIQAQASDPGCRSLIEATKAVVREKVVGLGRKDAWRPMLPAALVEEVARSLHGHPLGAHLGARRLLSSLSKHYVITNGLPLVQKVTNGCLRCRQRKPPLQKAGMFAATVPTTPWRTVAMDFAGPFIRSRNGCKYILVFMDQFTKWVELVPTRDQLASTVVQAFYANVICRQGCPEYLLSDRGPQFMGALVDTMCAHFGIKKIFSSAYYPQGDGFAERFMRTMNNSISALSREDPELWHTYVPGLAFAYNSSAHAATKISPFELNTGRVPSLPGGQNLGRGCSDEVIHLKRLRNVITNALQRTRQAIQGYWEQVKRRYDKQRREVNLRPGDLVLVRLSEYERRAFPCLKLAPRWSDIQTVEKKLSNGVTYRVTSANGRTESVHVSRLLPLRDPVWATVQPCSRDTDLTPAAQERSPYYNPCEARESAADGESMNGEFVIVTYADTPGPGAHVVDSRDDGLAQDTPPIEAAQVNPRCDVADSGGNPRGAQEESSNGSDPSVLIPDAPPGEGFFPVDRIIAKKADPIHGYVYRVRWLGYGPDHDTWQSSDDFPSPLVIEEFDNSVRDYFDPSLRTQPVVTTPGSYARLRS